MKYILIILISLTSCTFSHEMKRTYDFSKQFLGNELTRHMPTDISLNTSFVSTNISKSMNLEALKNGFTPLLTFIVEKYNEANFKTIINNLNIDSNNCYACNDTNSILIGSYLKHKYGYFEFVGFKSGKESRMIISRNERNKNNKPIPVFNLTECNSSFRVCVIESNYGIFLNERYLSTENLMPTNWEHGYSMGYTISKKERTIIYWTVVW